MRNVVKVLDSSLGGLSPLQLDIERGLRSEDRGQSRKEKEDTVFLGFTLGSIDGLSYLLQHGLFSELLSYKKDIKSINMKYI